VPTRVTLSGLVSTVLKLADVVGVTVLTEIEMRIAADEAISQMETELTRLQSPGEVAAINRSVQNDAAAAQVQEPRWHRAVLSWADGFGRFSRWFSGERWRNHLAIMRCISVAILVIIGTRLGETLCQLSEYVFNWVSRGEELLRDLPARTPNNRPMAHTKP
jgi:hypothetical protein